MKTATKKQMIDFLNGRYTYKGRKLPKNRLALLSEEDLMKIIKSIPDGIKTFEECLENDEGLTNERTVVNKLLPPQETSEEKTQELERLIETLAKDPTGFFAVLEFRSFLTNLPYGCVTNEKLEELAEKIENVAPQYAFRLNMYALDQLLYISKFEKQDDSSE